jgi:hypothetical protein
LPRPVALARLVVSPRTQPDQEELLSGNRLVNHSVTDTQVNLNKLGKVPSAKTADIATTALSATSATTAANLTGMTPFIKSISVGVNLTSANQ